MELFGVDGIRSVAFYDWRAGELWPSQRRHIATGGLFCPGLFYFKDFLMSEVKSQQFGTWVSELAQGEDRLSFKLLSGQTLNLYMPFHFGGEFVAGNASAGSNDRVAIRFDAVAAVRGQAAKTAKPS